MKKNGHFDLEWRFDSETLKNKTYGFKTTKTRKNQSVKENGSQAMCGDEIHKYLFKSIYQLLLFK